MLERVGSHLPPHTKLSFREEPRGLPEIPHLGFRFVIVDWGTTKEQRHFFSALVRRDACNGVIMEALTLLLRNYLIATPPYVL